MNLVEAANLEMADFEDWFDFDHAPEHSYGRKVIFQDETSELLLMSWLPGDCSMIHDHGGAFWGVVQVFGDCSHHLFRLKELELQEVRSEQLKSKQILGVTHEMIHQMSNDAELPMVSLHYYHNPEASGKITADTNLYDVLAGEVITVNGGAFYGLSENEKIFSTKGLKASFELVKREKQHLAFRLGKINGE